jgi:hypothetical protein
MRRLRPHEEAALALFRTRESVCPGEMTSEQGLLLKDALRTLAKLRLLVEDATDDGPAYSLSSIGKERLGN